MDDFSPGLEALFEGVDMPLHVHIKQRGVYLLLEMKKEWKKYEIQKIHYNVVQLLQQLIQFKA